MHRLLLFFAFLFPVVCAAQADTTAISYKEVSELRCPAPRHIDSMIAQLNTLSGVKMDTACLKKLHGLLDKFRNEDEKQRKKLLNQANSYAAGWREKTPGRCNAGGPPPICPVDHWYKASIPESMAEFHSVNREVFTRRLDEIGKALERCIISRQVPTRILR